MMKRFAWFHCGSEPKATIQMVAESSDLAEIMGRVIDAIGADFPSGGWIAERSERIAAVVCRESAADVVWLATGKIETLTKESTWKL